MHKPNHAIEIRERMATKTIAERLEQMLPLYEAMNAEVNMLIDEYVDEVVAPRCPGVPRGVLRALEVDQRVGTALELCGGPAVSATCEGMIHETCIARPRPRSASRYSQQGIEKVFRRRLRKLAEARPRCARVSGEAETNRIRASRRWLLAQRVDLRIRD
jgi:hypothetical protein